MALLYPIHEALTVRAFTSPRESWYLELTSADAHTLRELLSEQHPAAAQQLRASLDALPSRERDAWLDALFGIDAYPPQEADLPRGCVPYLPCPVDVLLRAVDQAGITSRDVFVDIGSGLGRSTALAHFLTGAGAIGIEIQAELAARARALAQGFHATRLATVVGDAAEFVRFVQVGTVFFLYCPFSGARLDRVLEHLEAIARTRVIQLCCVQMAELERSWLERTWADAELSIYRSRSTELTTT